MFLPIFGIGRTMDFVTGDSNIYEVHYELEGIKKVLIVEKSSMCEVDAWLCAVIYVCRDSEWVGSAQTYAQAKEMAARHAITSVRWNRLEWVKTYRPGLRIFGNELTSAVFQLVRSE